MRSPGEQCRRNTLEAAEVKRWGGFWRDDRGKLGKAHDIPGSAIRHDSQGSNTKATKAPKVTKKVPEALRVKRRFHVLCLSIPEHGCAIVAKESVGTDDHQRLFARLG